MDQDLYGAGFPYTAEASSNLPFVYPPFAALPFSVLAVWAALAGFVEAGLLTGAVTPGDSTRCWTGCGCSWWSS